MNVLITYECSGEVRRAFRERGHNAWSCDLKPAEDRSPYHLQMDAETAAYLPGWDLLIAHPVCTWLALSGLHWNGKGRQGRLPHECWYETALAAAAFMRMINAPIPRICVENPQCIMATYYRPADQKIQPYQFGHDASKDTWLWLKGLQPLKIDPALRVPGRMVLSTGKYGTKAPHMVERWSNQTDSGRNRIGPGSRRAADRARTFPGIARAFALNWG